MWIEMDQMRQLQNENGREHFDTDDEGFPKNTVKN